MDTPDFVYRRELPGGGWVVIEAAATEEVPASSTARLRVERRTDQTRRFGHTPPVLAEVTADSLDSAVDALRRIAADNVAVARAIMQWQARRRAQS